jgi:hypothetical protein
MRHRSKSIAPALLALTAACAPEPRAFCDRLNFCSVLSISADTCIQQIDTQLDALSWKGRDTFELFLTSCVAQPSCDTFFLCLETFPGANFATLLGRQPDPGSTPANTPVSAGARPANP